MLERNGPPIRNAAQAARVGLEKANARAQELREADRTRQQKKGSLDEDPETAPAEGTTFRHADSSQPDPATPTATLDQTPVEHPETILQGWAGSDPTPAATPTAPPAATPTPTAEPSDTGPTPAVTGTRIVSNDTGSGGALDALLTDPDPDIGSMVDTLAATDANDSTSGAVVGETVPV